MKLLPDEINDEASGKNIDSLAKSRRIRDEFISEFGFVPTSIIIHNKADKALDIAKDKENRGYICHRKQVKEIKDKTLNRIFSSSGRGEGALSAFPQSVGRILIKFYCPVGG